MKIKSKLAFLFLLFTLSCTNNNVPKKDKGLNIPEGYYIVKKYIDGDTFWLTNGVDDDFKVRLIGIDAPESRKTFKKEVGYFGKEAKEYVKKFLENQFIRLEYDVRKKDRYGRTLAYAYLYDGTFLNEHLIKNGYAVLMTVPPNVKYVDKFTKLQEYARENKLGLWNLELK